jgi:hypothetical protein
MARKSRFLSLLKVAVVYTFALIPLVAGQQYNGTVDYADQLYNDTTTVQNDDNIEVSDNTTVQNDDNIEVSDNTTGQNEAVSDNIDNIDCASAIHKYDPLIHVPKYRIAVYAIRGFRSAFAEYNLTFSEYLTVTAGRRFDPPIEFEMVPYDFDAVYEEEVDFFYANPAVYSCIGVEVGAQPLATTISRLDVRGHEYDLDVYGGVIFTQADNDEINGVRDLKDKIIGAGAISNLMAAQLQFYEMERAGMSYVMDPKQVVFTENQVDVVQGVLDGTFDVGFVRTGQIERHKDAKGKTINTGKCLRATALC